MFKVKVHLTMIRLGLPNGAERSDPRGRHSGWLPLSPPGYNSSYGNSWCPTSSAISPPELRTQCAWPAFRTTNGAFCRGCARTQAVRALPEFSFRTDWPGRRRPRQTVTNRGSRTHPMGGVNAHQTNRRADVGTNLPVSCSSVREGRQIVRLFQKHGFIVNYAVGATPRTAIHNPERAARRSDNKALRPPP